VGYLRVFRGECAPVSDCVHGECHLIGGVEPCGKLSVFRSECASVSVCVNGDCNMIGGVEQWERI
jgi:hypothetical protein